MANSKANKTNNVRMIENKTIVRSNVYSPKESIISANFEGLVTSIRRCNLKKLRSDIEQRNLQKSGFLLTNLTYVSRLRMPASTNEPKVHWIKFDENV